MGGTKKLGLFSAVCVCVGLIVATSCLVSLGTGVGLGGSGFILPLAIAFILNVFISFSFSELHAMMPNVTGGLGQYTAAAVGPVLSIISNTSAYVFCMIFAASAEAVMCGVVFTEAFVPGLSPIVVSVAITLLLAFANIRGIDIFSRIQNVTVSLLLGSMAVLAILSFFKVMPGAVAVQETPAITGFGDLAGMAAIGFWLFIGVEFVIPVSKYMKNPRRDVLLSMVIGLLLLFAVQGVLGVGMTHYVALSELSASTMPHMAFAEAMLGDVGKYWMGILTILAGISTLNTVLASTTRIMAGMAQGGMMPKAFAKENKREVPYGGLILMVVAMIIIVASGLGNSSAIITMILTGSCFWLLSYIITHTNVLVLRRRYPERAAHMKKVRLLGIPQIIGILGCLYMIVNISPDPAMKGVIFTVFGIAMALLIVYSVVWVKVVMKAGLFRPVPIEEIIEGGPVAVDTGEAAVAGKVAEGKGVV